MERDKKFRALAIAAICVAIVGVSVAYAALQASLTITGTASVNAGESANLWDIHFENASTTMNVTGSAVATKQPTISTDTTTVEFGATFTAPGDSVSFTVDAVNEGAIDAVLTNITKSIGGEAASAFTFDVKVGNNVIADNTLPATARLLNASDIATVTITVTFDSAGNLSADDLNALNTKGATFTFVMDFAQASSTDKTNFTTLKA